MDENEPLTEEEIKTLKEFAKNIQASGRVAAFLKMGLIWISSIVVAWLVIWENGIKHLFQSKGG